MSKAKEVLLNLHYQLAIEKLPCANNIAKSGEVLNWSGFSPFQLHHGLIVNHGHSKIVAMAFGKESGY